MHAPASHSEVAPYVDWHVASTVHALVHVLPRQRPPAPQSPSTVQARTHWSNVVLHEVPGNAAHSASLRHAKPPPTAVSVQASITQSGPALRSQTATAWWIAAVKRVLQLLPHSPQFVAVSYVPPDTKSSSIVPLQSLSFSSQTSVVKLVSQPVQAAPAPFMLQVSTPRQTVSSTELDVLHTRISPTVPGVHWQLSASGSQTERAPRPVHVNPLGQQPWAPVVPSHAGSPEASSQYWRQRRPSPPTSSQRWPTPVPQSDACAQGWQLATTRGRQTTACPWAFTYGANPSAQRTGSHVKPSSCSTHSVAPSTGTPPTLSRFESSEPQSIAHEPQ
jgi:hypothetical protein